MLSDPWSCLSLPCVSSKGSVAKTTGFRDRTPGSKSWPQHLLVV